MSTARTSADPPVAEARTGRRTALLGLAGLDVAGAAAVIDVVGDHA